MPVLNAWSLLKLPFGWKITTVGILKMKPLNFSTQFFLHLCLNFMCNKSCFEYEIRLVVRVVLSCLEDGPVASIHMYRDVEHHFVYQHTGYIAIVWMLPGTIYLWSVEWRLGCHECDHALFCPCNILVTTEYQMQAGPYFVSFSRCLTLMPRRRVGNHCCLLLCTCSCNMFFLLAFWR